MTLEYYSAVGAWLQRPRMPGQSHLREGGQDRTAPASSSNTGKTLLMGQSAGISLADRLVCALAQGRVRTQCHKNPVGVQTLLCPQQHQALLLEMTLNL